VSIKSVRRMALLYGKAGACARLAPEL
jgi:hypothetical protein